MELILAVILVFSLIGACLYLCRPPKPKSNVRSLSLGTISRQKPPVSAGETKKNFFFLSVRDKNHLSGYSELLLHLLPASPGYYLLVYTM
jgi:hypothetical protein